MFQSDLNKLINHEVKASQTKLYSYRFCCATISEFRYYKTKEQFLTHQKPTRIILFNKIKEVDTLNLNNTSTKNVSRHHLYIILHDSINSTY